MAIAWCRALKAMDRNGFSDPYLTLQVEGHKQRLQTKTINKTLNPTWNELYVITPVTSSKMLQIHVWDKDMIGKDDLIGCATVPLTTLARLPDEAGRLEHSAPEEGDAEWLPIRDSNGDETGQVGLALALKALSASRLQPASSCLPAGVGPDMEMPLMIRAVAGRNLKAMDRGGTCDPYLTFEVSSAAGKTTNKCKSKVIKKTCNPQWEEDMMLPVSGLEIGQELLVVKCFDKDMLGSDVIGGFQVPLAHIFSQPKAGAVWHVLREESAAGIEVTGEVLLQLTIEKPEEEEEMEEEGKPGAAGQVLSNVPVIGMGEYEDELLLSTEELLQRRRQDREQRGLLVRGSMEVSAQPDVTGDEGESKHVEGVVGELVKEGVTVVEGQRRTVEEMDIEVASRVRIRRAYKRFPSEVLQSAIRRQASCSNAHVHFCVPMRLACALSCQHTLPVSVSQMPDAQTSQWLAVTRSYSCPTLQDKTGDTLKLVTRFKNIPDHPASAALLELSQQAYSGKDPPSSAKAGPCSPAPLSRVWRYRLLADRWVLCKLAIRNPQALRLHLKLARRLILIGGPSADFGCWCACSDAVARRAQLVPHSQSVV